MNKKAQLMAISQNEKRLELVFKIKDILLLTDCVWKYEFNELLNTLNLPTIDDFVSSNDITRSDLYTLR